MSSTRQVTSADLGATDVFASPLWSARKDAGLGLDVECTKAAVDLQNLTTQTSDSIVASSLETLRRATAADVAVLAMLDDAGARFDRVTFSRGEAVSCDPQGLAQQLLADFPFLASRFEHLRLTEYRDTDKPTREEPAEAGRLASLGLASALIVTFHMARKPAGMLVLGRTKERGPWDVNFQLLLKLLGTSLATGLERLAMSTRLAEVDERTALIDAASNDGLWDFNFDDNHLYLSPRW
jgi:GAF domain-containing protein